MTLTRIVTGVIEDGTITSTDMAVDPRNASNLNSGDVPLAQLGNVESNVGIQEDVALLAFKTQANGNLARYNLIDQSVDSFEDASGINTGTSTGENRYSAGKYYSGGVAGNWFGVGSQTTIYVNKTKKILTSSGYCGLGHLKYNIFLSEMPIYWTR